MSNIATACRTAVEAERARMASEIHDGLAQSLLTLILQARTARLEGLCSQQRLLQSLEQVELLAVASLEEARRCVFALRPAKVASEGLVCALRQLVGSLSIAGRTRFVLVNRAGKPDVSPSVEDAVYRIVQEATQNALKHAGAGLVTIRLHKDVGRLRVRVEDDGDGMECDAIQRARERGGLRAMRERAEDCGGSLVVEPCPTRGTRVDALLPLRSLSE